MTALLASASGRSTDSNTVTTSAIDTSGASCIVLALSTINAAGLTIVDNYGNTWQAGTASATAGTLAQLFFAMGPSVKTGPGHYFSATQTGGNPSLVALAYTGINAFGTQSGNTSAAGQSIQGAVALTGTTDNEVVIFVETDLRASGANTVDSSFSDVVNVIKTANAASIYVGHKFETAPVASENPTVSVGGGANTQISIRTIRFKGGAIPTRPSQMVNFTAKQAASISTVTTDPMDTTQADLLVAICTSTAAAAITFTDSRGNTWTSLTKQNGAAGTAIQPFYCKNPLTAVDHTFTDAATNGAPCVAVYALKGMAPSTIVFDTSARASGNGVTNQQPGSITPGDSGEFIIVAFNTSNAQLTGINTIDSNIVVDFSNDALTNSEGLHVGHITQASPAAINPKLQTTGVAEEITAYVLSFLIAGAARSSETLSNDGRVWMTDNETPTIASSFYNGAWAHRQTDGSAYMHDVAAGAVPATAKFIGSYAFSQQGSLYVTTQAVANSDVWFGGIRFRNDGAMRVVVSSPTASSAYVNGWFFDSNFRLHIRQN